MSDEQIELLEFLIKNAAAFGMRVYFKEDGGLYRIRSLTHNHKERPDDPQEVGEPVVWLENKEGCRSLWASDCEDFMLMQEQTIQWPD